MPLTLLFDLDGTLVDSIELILRSGRHAFEGDPGRIPTDDEWRAAIGRPLAAMFRGVTDDEADVDRLIARYREYQLEHHDRLMRAYDGVVPLLQSLAARGHAIALVTSKVEWLAHRALQHVGLGDAIFVVVGCDSCTRHKPDPEPVERALALLGASPGDTLFIGDSTHDIEAGRAAGVRTIGVSWGAFSRKALELAHPDLVVDDVASLAEAIDRFEGRP